MITANSNNKSIQKYRKKAHLYDGTSHRTDWIRDFTIDHLQLKAGDTVLDVGCGTGLSFTALCHRVGPEGRVIGVDQSPEMLDLANARIAKNQWSNVEVIQSHSETVTLSEPVNAYLFHYTHDILQSKKAVENLFSFAAPNARIAIAGMKFFPWWTGPLNIYAFFKNYAWNGNGSGLARPWRHIEQRAKIVSWRPTQLGMGYIASAQMLATDE
jgi:arsenite methyltransferase